MTLNVARARHRLVAEVRRVEERHVAARRPRRVTDMLLPGSNLHGMPGLTLRVEADGDALCRLQRRALPGSIARCVVPSKPVTWQNSAVKRHAARSRGASIASANAAADPAGRAALLAAPASPSRQAILAMVMA